MLSDGIAPTHRSWATEQNSTRGILFLLVLWGRNSTRGILSYSRDGRRPRRLIGESKNLIAKGRLNRPFAGNCLSPARGAGTITRDSSTYAGGTPPWNSGLVILPNRAGDRSIITRDSRVEEVGIGHLPGAGLIHPADPSECFFNHVWSHSLSSRCSGLRSLLSMCLPSRIP